MGFKYPVRKHVEKGMMVQTLQDVIMKVEPFVAWWVVQTKENMHELEAIRDHMSPWGVARKRKCYCQLVLRLQLWT
jgi:hypothetical protein